MATRTNNKGKTITKGRLKGQTAEAQAGETKHLVVSEPKLRMARFTIVGISPYVQNKMSGPKRDQMMKKHEAGSTAKTKKIREKRNFNKEYEEAQHRSDKGWVGLPAPAFRAAMIDACRLVGYHMTMAKMSVFVLPDGFDKDEGTPLVKFTKGKPKKHVATVRNKTGVCDVRVRPMWAPGWECIVCIQYDADQFTIEDVTNLMRRAGRQLGIGEGRPYSKDSYGQGWGMFDIKNVEYTD